MPNYANESEMQTLEAYYKPDADRKMMVRFEYFPVQDKAASTDQGRPIYHDVEHITIITPGDRDNIVHRKCFPADKKRFAPQYAAWKEGRDQDAADGTHLSAWPGITRAQIEELAYFHVKTVEQLANMSDTVAQKFMGIQLLRTRAKDFLEASKGSAHTEKLRAEIVARDNDISLLKKQMADLSEMLSDLKKPKK